MKYRPLHERPTVDRLRELFTYDPHSGTLAWVVDRFKVRVGDAVRCVTPDGYLVVGIDGKRYYAHVVIWAIVTGEWSDGMIDHKNRIKSENWWGNLREASDQQNRANSLKSRSNKVGLKGVIRFQGKFRAQITINRKTVWLGDVDCPAAAHFMYAVAADAAFGCFSRS